MKKLVLLASIAFVLSCTKNTTEENNSTPTDSTNVAQEVAKQTYAIVGFVSTDDKNKYNEYITKQAEQTDKLWNSGIVENIYYNAEPRFTKDRKNSTIAFFIKAKDENDAKAIINETAFLVNGVGEYNIHPVGSLWLQMSDKAGDIRKKKGKVYAAVWSLAKPISDIAPKVLEEQFNFDLNLNKEGTMENAYLNMTKGDSTKAPAIYFINASNEAEASEILNQSPLVKSKDGSYILHYVGAFTRGKKD